MPIAESFLESAALQMSLLMFVALAGYLLAYRINQSAVVGIILAGILVGPSLLGLVTYTDFVSTMAHLGAVVLLFTIGLEFNIRDLTRFKYFLIALLGIIVPWIAGFYLAKLFDYDSKAAIFIGTALTATSIAITANVLREMNKLQTDVGKAIIGAAVIDDVLALLVLSFSEGIVTGTLSASSLLLMVARATAFLVVGGLVGKFLVARIMVRIDNTKVAMKYPESLFIFAVMVAFLYAVIAEVVGLSAIIGSFLAGVALSHVNLKRGDIFRDGAEHLQIIFASIFFVSLGVLMDAHAITLQVLFFTLMLTLVAAFTKIFGCGLPAKLQGISMKDSVIIGFGMMPRGEVAMIIALIGLNEGLIFQDTYAALILMSLLTTIIPPIVMRNWLFKPDKVTISEIRSPI